jgi:N12 class adenine-specific DNA methylase
LTFIQFSQDGLPIELKKLAEVASCDLVSAEKLVLTLLKTNLFIGTYDIEEKIYTKGIDVNDYIESILKDRKIDKDFEESHAEYI